MSVLSNLKVTDGNEKAQGYDPIRTRRKKLAAALQDQLNLLAAGETGDTYRRTRVKRKRDLETDELFDVEQHRRVTPWWWIDDDGLVKLSLRYGSVRLKVKDGMTVIILPSLAALQKMLPALRQEALVGSLDEALADAAADLQARFKGRKINQAKAKLAATS